MEDLALQISTNRLFDSLSLPHTIPPFEVDAPYLRASLSSDTPLADYVLKLSGWLITDPERLKQWDHELLLRIAIILYMHDFRKQCHEFVTKLHDQEIRYLQTEFVLFLNLYWSNDRLPFLAYYVDQDVYMPVLYFEKFDPWLARAENSKKNGDPISAAAHYLVAHRVYSLDLWVHVQFAQIVIREGWPDWGLELVEAAIQIDPTYGPLWTVLAAAYMAKWQFHFVRPLLQYAVFNFDESHDIVQLMIRSMSERELYSAFDWIVDTIRATDEYQPKYEDYIIALQFFFYTHMKEFGYRTAQAALRTYNSAELQEWLAVFTTMIRSPVTAVKTWLKFYEDHPERLSLYIGAGLAARRYVSRGLHFKLLLDAWELNPSHRVASRHIWRYYLNVYSPYKKLALLHFLIKLFPSDPEYIMEASALLRRTLLPALAQEGFEIMVDIAEELGNRRMIAYFKNDVRLAKNAVKRAYYAERKRGTPVKRPKWRLREKKRKPKLYISTLAPYLYKKMYRKRRLLIQPQEILDELRGLDILDSIADKVNFDIEWRDDLEDLNPDLKTRLDDYNFLFLGFYPLVKRTWHHTLKET